MSCWGLRHHKEVGRESCVPWESLQTCAPVLVLKGPRLEISGTSLPFSKSASSHVNIPAYPA